MAGPAHAYQPTFTAAQGALCERMARQHSAPQARYPNLILVHPPTHASWLNQIEIYYSIVRRKALTPNDFPNLAAVEQRLLAFAAPYNDTAVPFRWRFTRQRLDDRLAALPDRPPPRLASTDPVKLPQLSWTA